MAMLQDHGHAKQTAAAVHTCGCACVHHERQAVTGSTGQCITCVTSHVEGVGCDEVLFHLGNATGSRLYTCVTISKYGRIRKRVTVRWRAFVRRLILIMHAKTACQHERNSLWHALLGVFGVLWRYGRWLARANALFECTPQSPSSMSARRFAMRCFCVAATAVTSSLAPLGSHTRRAWPAAAVVTQQQGPAIMQQAACVHDRAAALTRLTGSAKEPVKRVSFSGKLLRHLTD